MSKSNLEQRISSLVKPVVQDMQSYHVASAEGMLKLDAMENPYTFEGELRKELLARLADVDINRYPDPVASGVSKKLAACMNVPDSLSIMLGNGSDELIQILAFALAVDGAKMLAVEPSFVMYKAIADSIGMDYVSVPLQADFTLDVEAVVTAVNEHQPALLFFAVPNNPTGNCFSETDMRRVIEAADGLVIIDEAYVPFTDVDMLHLAVEYDNVMVMRTLSKVGLAGLRLGMMFGKPEWIDQFDKVRLPYNINVLTQVAAEFALDHYDVLLSQAQSIIEQRQSVYQQLQALEGVEVFESQANFFLLRTQKDAVAIHQALKDQGILIKCLANGHPLLANCLRITVSTPEENARLLSALKTLV